MEVYLPDVAFAVGIKWKEFETARYHLLKNLPGCIAWRPGSGNRTAGQGAAKQAESCRGAGATDEETGNRTMMIRG